MAEDQRTERRASYWDRAKQSAAGAAAATQRAAKRTKLKAEIQMLLSNVKGQKQDFGVLAYDLVIAGDMANAQKIALEKQEKVSKWNASIAEKRAEIQRLNDEARAAGEKLGKEDEEVTL